ncbi:IPT/TIG domain-containing protein [uncultured Hymenobacter sp.]|uniref:IPT/TIG domain-containing protein n=1 Tax=uncultured Hymenobacter sp. TaxID=170016 RepID=UPI0035CA1472
MTSFFLFSRRSGRNSQAGSCGVLLGLALGLPLLVRAQTTIVNYDFNSAAAYPAAPATTAPGVTSAANGSQPFAPAPGAVTGAGAFAANPTAGNALNMANSSGTGKYFEFSLGGADLPKYSAFKLYLQSQRSGTGATTLTLQYSVNGGAYMAVEEAVAPGTGSFAEGSFDLSGQPALNRPGSLTFRLLASGGTSTSGTLRLDNFQVQAVNTVDPTITSLAPNPVEAGSPGFALTVGGRNFQDGAVVMFNGSNLVTAYVSATSLTAQVPAAAIATAGNYAVTVTNPAGGATSPAFPFGVTPALPRWTGAARTGSWFDAGNWSLGRVPGSGDEVLLDHRFVAGPYTVSLDQNIAVGVKSLTINPGAGDSIFVLVPVSNTMTPSLILTNSGTGVTALAIHSKGVITNASGAASGTGVDVTGSGPVAFIYNGGSYRHASRTSHARVAENLSAVAGTEFGIFDFRPPAGSNASTTLSASGRTYGTLVLRSRPGAGNTYSYAGSGNALTIQGNLIIGAGVRFTTTLSNDLRLLGDLKSQGTLQMRPSNNSLVSQLVLAGTEPQTISGTITLDPTVGLALNNSAGVLLATPLRLDGPLTLTSGALTTSAANLLTLGSTASLPQSSSTSFINGPLARQTAAGAVSNLVFPTGSGLSYRPVVLNATAQDASTYLVAQREGPAPDRTKLLATTALPALTHVSGARSFSITSTPTVNNFSGTVTLSFGPDDQVNEPEHPGLTVGKNSGAGWENIGRSRVAITMPAPVGGYASGTITSGTFTSFSDFALARTNAEAAINPLPVTLASFGARRQRADVQLSWTTASELNSKHFEVQRSSDGRLFSTITTVAGHGTTSQAQHYAVLDRAAPAAALYYRLVQLDKDGRAAFGPVVALAPAAGSSLALTLTLYPNPAHDRLSVPAPAGTIVHVLDLTGRILQTTSLPPSGELMLPGLPAGAYLLRTADGRVWRFGKE